MTTLSASEQHRRNEAHWCGVHVDCRPGGPRGDVWQSCRHAGRVERFHAHSFPGPLTCGCDDFAVEAS